MRQRQKTALKEFLGTGNGLPKTKEASEEYGLYKEYCRKYQRTLFPTRIELTDTHYFQGRIFTYGTA